MVIREDVRRKYSFYPTCKWNGNSNWIRIVKIKSFLYQRSANEIPPRFLLSRYHLGLLYLYCPIIAYIDHKSISRLILCPLKATKMRSRDELRLPLTTDKIVLIWPELWKFVTGSVFGLTRCFIIIVSAPGNIYVL